MLETILIQHLSELYAKKKYFNIYTLIIYINTIKQKKNTYLNKADKLYSYIYATSLDKLHQQLNIFYKCIIIYRFIIKHKYKNNDNISKIIINDTTLYSEDINTITKKLLYLRCMKTNRYYAFTLYELNKLITNTLLFNYNNDGIISSKMPKHPWTNEVFNINQLEYILYIFKYNNFNYHKIIDMFSRSNYNINNLTNNYQYYLKNVSIKKFIINLDPVDFRILFTSLWCLMTPYNNEDINIIENYNINKPKLSTLICKKCVLSIPNKQSEFSDILSKFYKHLYRKNINTRKKKRLLSILKKTFIVQLYCYYPHVFKNNQYYHLHYNKYNLLKYNLKKNKFTFSPIIDFPISGFTNDCKIIYNCNGIHCILKGQVLIKYDEI